MKAYKKLLIMTVMALFVVTCFPKAAKAAVNGTTYTFTDNTITISWLPADQQEGWDEGTSVTKTIDSYYLKIYNSTTSSWDYLSGFSNMSPAVTSCTVNITDKGYTGYWKLGYRYTRTTAYSSIAGQEYDYYSTFYVNNTPADITNKNFGIGSVLSSTKKISFAVNKTDGMTGTQIQIYRGKKRIVNTTFKYTYSDYYNYKNDTVYKYRMRAYYTNPDTNITYYGAWTAYKYIDSASGTISKTYNKRGCKIKLKRVTGVKSYTIKISTNSNKGFKKTATVTVSGKTKTVSITKIGKKSMKKGKTYYIRIIPNIKVGSKTVESDVYSTSSFVNPR